MTLPLYKKLEYNLTKISEDLGKSSDLIIRTLNITTEISLALVYIDGLTDKELIESSILEKILLLKDYDASSIHLEFLKEKIITYPEIRYASDYSDVYSAILSGETVIFVNGKSEAFIASTRKWEARAVAEPTTQVVVRGPKEGFVESIATNIALVRRRIKDKNLWVEMQNIGTVTDTPVAIMYLHGTVDTSVLDEVHKRLSKIEPKAILESSYIEELIQDSTFSPFPTVYNTERPDVIAGGLLEGRVAIIVDGTPFALLVPSLFTHFIQSPEDYYHRSDFGLLRILRIACLGIALLAPSIYIALTTFHQETIPTVLLISLAAQREGVPFPAFFEALSMELVFEILREAGIRMPRMIGQTMSIVGALVIGQAAVEAGFISSAMIIVVAVTAIASFVLPTYSIGISVRLLRFPMMFLAATFGFYGIAVGVMMLILHLAHLKSFTVPFMYNIGPFNKENQEDSIFRFPQKYLKSNKPS